MAKMCGMSRSNWWKWVRDGKAPQPTEDGKWLADDIKKWLKTKKKRSRQTGSLISE